MNKKNIFTKNNLMIKINTETHKHKSMNDALKDDEVLLWGLNQVDSLILASYELNYFKQNIIKKINLNEQIKMSINKKIICEKTSDIQYNPSNTYNHCDLQFLINEYDRIDYDLSMMKELNDEFNNLLDVQDKLGDLIDELENNQESNVEGYNNNLISLYKLDVDMEIEINKKQISNKTKKMIRSSLLEVIKIISNFKVLNQGIPLPTLSLQNKGIPLPTLSLLNQGIPCLPQAF